MKLILQDFRSDEEVKTVSFETINKTLVIRASKSLILHMMIWFRNKFLVLSKR